MTTSTQVAAQLRAQIASGELRVGSPVPTLKALAELHDCAEETARRAVDNLKAEGLILTKRGRGSIVARSNSDRLVIKDIAYRREEREHPTGATSYEQRCNDRGELARTLHHVDPLPQPAAPWLCARFEEDSLSVNRFWGEGYYTPKGSAGLPDLGMEQVGWVFTSWVRAADAERVPSVLEPRPSDGPDVWIGGLYSKIERGLNLTFRPDPCSDIYGRWTSTEETERFGEKAPFPVLIQERWIADTDGIVRVVGYVAVRVGMVRFTFRPES